MGVIKSGKVVIVLSGRFAGRKGIVVKTYDEGTPDRKFGHCIVAGIDRYPRKVTRAMSKEKVEKRIKMKPFLKYINYSHLMPTRYVVDLDFKKVVEENGLKEGRADAKKAIKKMFEERYTSQTSAKKEKKATGVSYFYKKMAF
ncbi:ribosomal L27e protein family-domain-containing protein [Pelagophyceae sp. CCMP2097]|nr:ribosomal L27e protein family-domain-containing protein [Pelagophyceae sp. CCMP2097]